MYDNEFKTKGNKIQTKDKIEPQHTQSFIKPVFPRHYKLPCFPFYQTAFPVVQPLALLNLDQHLEISAVSRKKQMTALILSCWKSQRGVTSSSHQISTYFREKNDFFLKMTHWEKIFDWSPYRTPYGYKFFREASENSWHSQSHLWFPYKIQSNPALCTATSYGHLVIMDTSMAFLWCPY